MRLAVRFLRPVVTAVVVVQLAACSQQPVVALSRDEPLSMDDVSECRDLLVADAVSDDALDSSHIRLFNWNLQKSRAPGWRDDFDALAGSADLVLFQEASIREDTIDAIDSSLHWSFAPGYSTLGEITGVMTLSRPAPLSQCTFSASEPWLRTPKAASLTQYALSGSDETLVVVNVHAVNFTFGTDEYAAQFRQLGEVLAAHTGPIILSGDLNTWRGKRARIVADLAESLSLSPVGFDTDHRKRMFGKALDHIYVRGLQILDAETEIVSTSDHNPMIAEFGIAGMPLPTAVLAE